MTKRQKDKRRGPKREFNIAMSGQFRTLAMFLCCGASLRAPVGAKNANFSGGPTN